MTRGRRTERRINTLTHSFDKINLFLIENEKVQDVKSLIRFVLIQYLISTFYRVSKYEDDHCFFYR